MTDSCIPLVQAIVARRKELGLSQADLAESCGLKQPAIARLERGYNAPQLDTYLRVAHALGMDLELVKSPCLSQQKERNPNALNSVRS